MTVNKRVTRSAKRKSLLEVKKLGLMDMPDEILLNIISLIPRPYEHLVFPSVSARICRLYTAKMYQNLCCSYGFGRSLEDKTRSWRKTFKKVVKHMKTCGVETCAQKGVALPDKREPLLSDWSTVPDKHGTLHPYLFSLGNVRLKDFVEGCFADGFTGYDFEYDVEDGGRFDKLRVEGIDWNSDSGVMRAGRCRHRLENHLLLGSAFACMPPTPILRVEFDGLATFDVLNRNGVTVADFRMTLNEWIYDEPDENDLAVCAEGYNISMDEARDHWIGITARMGIVEESTCFRMAESRDNALLDECFLLETKPGVAFPKAYFFQMVEEDQESS